MIPGGGTPVLERALSSAETLLSLFRPPLGWSAGPVRYYRTEQEQYMTSSLRHSRADFPASRGGQEDCVPSSGPVGGGRTPFQRPTPASYNLARYTT